MTNVFVAIYEYRDDTNVGVFATEDGARALVQLLRR